MLVNWKNLRNRVPHKVQISRDVFYDVLWQDKVAEGFLYGQTDYEKRQIILETGMSNKQTVCTFLHELAHAVSGVYDVGLTETQVQALEKSIYYLLKDGNVFLKE